MMKPSPEITQTLSLNKEGFIENPENWDTHFTEKYAEQNERPFRTGPLENNPIPSTVLR